MIYILLATHNGARHLPQLLQSIFQQSVAEWRMLVRDDSSLDETATIVSEAAQGDSRITLLVDDDGRKGAAMNFGALMQAAQSRNARYVLFADQDDVWLPDKLERSMRVMESAEASAGRHLPLLVHADLSVVDDRLRVIHPSMTAYAGIRRNPHDPLRTLLVYNLVTGCTAMMNRPLLDAALPLPQAAVMHDWWVALCAAALGEIWHLPEPVALYRQHAGNAVGVRSYWQTFLPLGSYWKSRWDRAGIDLACSIEQAKALCRRLQARGNDEHGSYAVVEDYCRLFAEEESPWRRYRGIRRLRIGPRDVARQLSLAARVFRLPPLELAEWHGASCQASGPQIM